MEEIRKSRYETLGEWRKAQPNAHRAAIRRGMIDEICTMFGWSRYQRKNSIDNSIKISDMDKTKQNRLATQVQGLAESIYGISIENLAIQHSKEDLIACYKTAIFRIKERLEKLREKKEVRGYPLAYFGVVCTYLTGRVIYYIHNAGKIDGIENMNLLPEEGQPFNLPIDKRTIGSEINFI